MEEVWKDVVGYEGLYQVSNLGRVKSLERIIKYDNREYKRKEKTLKNTLNRDGYVFVKLLKDSIPQTCYIHRLVAFAFIKNPFNYEEVNHKDENKQNNVVFINPDGSVDEEKSNLEWCTKKYNVNYGTAIQRRIETVNRNGGKKAETPVNQFDLDGKFLKRFKSAHQAARDLNLCEAGIVKCCNGQRNKCGGFVFLKDKDIDNVLEKIKPKKQGKKVAQYDSNNNLIKIWDNGVEACKSFGISSGYLSLCCRGFYKYGKGFIWKFV